MVAYAWLWIAATGIVGLAAGSLLSRWFVPDQPVPAAGCDIPPMGSFVFTCPSTRLKVQGWSSDEAPAYDHFEAIKCTACQRIHLVNARTGKVAGSEVE